VSYLLNTKNKFSGHEIRLLGPKKENLSKVAFQRNLNFKIQIKQDNKFAPIKHQNFSEQILKKLKISWFGGKNCDLQFFGNRKIFCQLPQNCHTTTKSKICVGFWQKI
jgi:hypothetical protein